MVFNAHLEFEEVARERGMSLPDLVVSFGRDLAAMVQSCDVFRLRVTDICNISAFSTPVAGSGRMKHWCAEPISECLNLGLQGLTARQFLTTSLRFLGRPRQSSAEKGAQS